MGRLVQKHERHTKFYKQHQIVFLGLSYFDTGSIKLSLGFYVGLFCNRRIERKYSLPSQEADSAVFVGKHLNFRILILMRDDFR